MKAIFYTLLGLTIGCVLTAIVVFESWITSLSNNGPYTKKTLRKALIRQYFWFRKAKTVFRSPRISYEDKRYLFKEKFKLVLEEIIIDG